jgi:hypothetical protein
VRDLYAEPAARTGHPAAAIRLDPADPNRWCDLGDHFAAGADPARAESCFRRAVQLGPAIPPVLVRAANFHLGQGEVREALPLFARVLSLVAVYDSIIFSTYRRFAIPLEEVLQSGLPDDPRVRRAWFADLTAWAEPESAARGWRMLSERGLADDASAGAYLNLLWKCGRYPEAVRIWSDVAGPRAGDYPASNLLYNGGFEQEISGTPLDWQVAATGGASAARDREVAHEGGASLRIEFDGEASLDFRHVSNAAFLPAGRYRLQAMLRTSGLTTPQGVYLRVTGAAPLSRLEERTPAVSADSGWTALGRLFEVREPGAAVRVEVRRDPFPGMDRKIRGRVWVDAVAIRPDP